MTTFSKQTKTAPITASKKTVAKGSDKITLTKADFKKAASKTTSKQPTIKAKMAKSAPKTAAKSAPTGNVSKAKTQALTTLLTRLQDAGVKAHQADVRAMLSGKALSKTALLAVRDGMNVAINDLRTAKKAKHVTALKSSLRYVRRTIKSL
jgi:hypothetical protein